MLHDHFQLRFSPLNAKKTRGFSQKLAKTLVELPVAPISKHHAHFMMKDVIGVNGHMFVVALIQAGK
jgi:hypothetical protein